MRIKVDANKCEKCAYIWLGDPDASHCASSKCRSRLWNESERNAIVQKLKDRRDGKKTGINDGPPKSIIDYSPKKEPLSKGCKGCGALGGIHQKWCDA